MYDTVLWDLDGTLTRSEEGIYNSIQYAAAKFGLPPPERRLLRPFIGPPLQQSFRNFFGLNEEDGAKMVAFYREYYSAKGVLECEVYCGVEQALSALYSAGITLALATSKPEKFARAVLSHFGLLTFFSAISAADMSPQSADKARIVARALEMCGVKDKSRALMVGDRLHDVIGAKANGVKCAGVLYGYGDRSELEQYGADYIAATPSDVVGIALGGTYSRT